MSGLATAPAGSSPDVATLDRVRATEDAVHTVGGAWFFAPQVRAVGEEAGITDRFAFYAGGRGGATGDPTGEVVASCFAFFPARIVVEKYRTAIQGHNPHDVATLYATGQAAWARDVFGEDQDWGRLAELGRRVADSVRPMGLPLFAAWRSMPRPEDPAADMALAMQVLRELRGDLHIQAVVTTGMTPLEAIIGKDGPERAAELFYAEPYPTPAEVAVRREAVERLTDRLTAPAWQALRPDEWDEVDHLLASAVPLAVASTARAEADAAS
ncbi:SCO6745 family protein [Euzebya tangerina]|uniref:SCO6745 family protein n=1 Tax=Euzebya tangerina TaxID=591198 RepID=UPI000E312B5A|nr:hypothetical protein [Euzebya tangerina]